MTFLLKSYSRNIHLFVIFPVNYRIFKNTRSFEEFITVKRASRFLLIVIDFPNTI